MGINTLVGETFTMKRSYCPQCKSTDVKFYSKRKYFLRLAICVAVVLYSLATIISLIGNQNAGALFGAICSGILICLSVILGIYYLIRGICIRDRYYKCGYCKNRFITGLIVHEIDDDVLLARIRKNG